jgi:hypothetical protein
MSEGDQFKGEINETTLYDPTDRQRHAAVA